MQEHRWVEEAFARCNKKALSKLTCDYLRETLVNIPGLVTSLLIVNGHSVVIVYWGVAAENN